LVLSNVAKVPPVEAFEAIEESATDQSLNDVTHGKHETRSAVNSPTVCRHTPPTIRQRARAFAEARHARRLCCVLVSIYVVQLPQCGAAWRAVVGRVGPRPRVGESLAYECGKV